MNKLELVCPAGNRESLEAAVAYGADSVYLGGSSFGARASAKNFDDDALVDAVTFAHRNSVRILLTVNTLILENEMDRALAQVDAIHRAGADALIVQDIGLAQMIHKRYPNAPLHGSTQMAIHNTSGVRELEKMGFRRVVLARECSLRDIETISQNTSIELEAFCHGALCVSVSGACIMSSIIGGRSGNRGRCAQPCRLPYTLFHDGKAEKSGYLLSPKDLCTLPLLEKMVNAGVTAFKIEGRLKRPGYVANMTKTYREALDAIERSGSYTPTQQDMDRLASVFARGGKFTTGYLTAKLDHTELMSHAITSYPETAAADEMPIPYLRKKPIVDAYIELIPNKVPTLTLAWENHMATIIGDEPVQTAQKQPVSIESITRSLSKTNNTPFTLGCVNGKLDNAYISAAQLNAMRRESLERLEIEWMQSRLPQWTKDEAISVTTKVIPHNEVPQQSKLWVSSPNLSHAEAALIHGADGVYLTPSRWDKPLNEIVALAKYRKQGKQIYLALPLLLREADNEIVCQQVLACREYIDGILASNIGIMSWALQQGLCVVGDIALNITNPWTKDYYVNMGASRVTLSPEMTAAQVRDCVNKQYTCCEAILYGRLPLMTLSHCPIRACANTGTGNCHYCQDKAFSLKDRLGLDFPLRRTKLTQCQLTVLNSVPLSLAAQWNKLPSIRNWRVQLTDESIEDSKRIVQLYHNLIHGKDCTKDVLTITNSTSGHWFRGVQ